MKLTRTGPNQWTWEGLTEGKLISLYNALDKLHSHEGLTPVAKDIYIFFRRSKVINFGVINFGGEERVTKEGD